MILAPWLQKRNNHSRVPYPPSLRLAKHIGAQGPRVLSSVMNPSERSWKPLVWTNAIWRSAQLKQSHGPRHLHIAYKTIALALCFCHRRTDQQIYFRNSRPKKIWLRVSNSTHEGSLLYRALKLLCTQRWFTRAIFEFSCLRVFHVTEMIFCDNNGWGFKWKEVQKRAVHSHFVVLPTSKEHRSWHRVDHAKPDFGQIVKVLLYKLPFEIPVWGCYARPSKHMRNGRLSPVLSFGSIACKTGPFALGWWVLSKHRSDVHHHRRSKFQCPYVSWNLSKDSEGTKEYLFSNCSSVLPFVLFQLGAWFVIWSWNFWCCHLADWIEVFHSSDEAVAMVFQGLTV